MSFKRLIQRVVSRSLLLGRGSTAEERIIWAPRVKMSSIFSLYERLAHGSCDEKLVDEIASAFYSRCQSIIDVTEASKGRVRCRKCGAYIIRQTSQKDELLRCDKCGWSTSWRAFFESYHRKQLTGGSAYQVFIDFVERLPKCSSVRDKLFLIDWIIHQCHIGVTTKRFTPVARPVAVNLIEGKVSQLIPFMENLPSAPDPRMQDAFNKWKKIMAESMKPIGYSRSQT